MRLSPAAVGAVLCSHLQGQSPAVPCHIHPAAEPPSPSSPRLGSPQPTPGVPPAPGGWGTGVGVTLRPERTANMVRRR